MDRSAGSGTYLSDLIRLRRSQLVERDPVILVPRSFAVTTGETSDQFLGLGLPLYLDSLSAQITAPLTSSQSSTTGGLPKGWDQIDSHGVVYIEVYQNLGSALTNPGRNLITAMSIPVYERAPRQEIARSSANEIDPQKPLFGRAEVIWPNYALSVPYPVKVLVTALFAVEAKQP